MYKSLAEARRDGWELIPCAFPTTYAYYAKPGERNRREDELVEGMEPKPILTFGDTDDDD